MDTQRDGADSSGRLMNYRLRLGLLVLILVLVAVGVAVTATVSLYKLTLRQQRQRLVEIAGSQARLIETLARFAREQPGQEGSEDAGDVTIKLVADAHRRFTGLGKTGEFTLARHEGESIVFLLSRRHLQSSIPSPVPFDGELAEPMRRALQGHSGTVVDLDYRGQEVVAAYEPVAELGFGIVAKIDLDEIGEPFISVGLVVSGCTLILVLAGADLFHRIYSPVVAHLEESERKYRSVYSSAPLAFVIWDRDCRIVDWNEQAERLFGWSFEEVQGRSFFDLIIPDSSRALVEQIVEALLSGELPRQVVNENITKDGRVILCEWNNEIRYDALGRVVGAISLGLDISMRHQAEQDLRESEQRFHSLFQSMNESVVLHDVVRDESGAAVDYRILDVNPAFEAMVSISREQDGTIYYETRAVARVENGQRVGLTLHTRNITDRKLADEQRRNLEAQLLHAQKLESLGILAGGIAHDFNNILTSVLGHADLVLAEVTPGSSEHENVEGIIQAARRAAELSGQMLAYSGRGSFVVEAIDLSLLVREMQQLFATSVNKKTTVEYRLDPDLPAVRGDVTQVRQIILNLIINAAEAIGESCGLIAVTTRSLECDRQLLCSTYVDDDLPAGTYACLEVSDTGCGMDEATREKIFDPFFTTKFTGRGLGLAALLGIVRSHQGAIRVESTPDQGTTIQVLFPAVGLTPLKQSEQEVTAADLQGCGTILLVDDEALVRKTVRKMLERFGFELLEAADGREAVEIFREHADEIALVLLDMKMPVMGGEEAFDKISKLRNDIKVILSSGFNEEDATASFGDRKPAGFIKKPYRMSELRESIRTVLNL
jgi:PAS domain S-box-containing protein